MTKQTVAFRNFANAPKTHNVTHSTILHARTHTHAVNQTLTILYAILAASHMLKKKPALGLSFFAVAACIY